MTTGDIIFYFVDNHMQTSTAPESNFHGET